jgi:hypothetical protein
MLLLLELQLPSSSSWAQHPKLLLKLELFSNSFFSGLLLLPFGFLILELLEHGSRLGSYQLPSPISPATNLQVPLSFPLKFLSFYTNIKVSFFSFSWVFFCVVSYFFVRQCIWTINYYWASEGSHSPQKVCLLFFTSTKQLDILSCGYKRCWYQLVVVGTTTVHIFCYILGPCWRRKRKGLYYKFWSTFLTEGWFA